MASQHSSPHPALVARAASLERAPLGALLACVLGGLLVRAVFWFLTGTPELQSDEANYLHLAVQWKQLGFYPDSFRYLWPPGYPAYLRICIEIFGLHALDAARIGQVLASSSIGLSTGLLAWRAFGARAGILAAVGWACYLPLAAFTHLLWNETLFLALFLPALYQILACLQDPQSPSLNRRLLIAGVTFSLALYIKEAATYLLPLLALILLTSQATLKEGVRQSSLLLGTVALCLLPWGLRNHEVYGKFIPLGASLGENVFNGLNASYRNFDLIPLESKLAKAGQAPLATRSTWTAPPTGASPWLRAEERLSLPERLAENTSRGLAFAAAHPVWLIKSRIQKLSDAVVPTSFFTRHLALGNYPGPIGRSPLRPLVAWTSGLQVAALLALGGAGLLASLGAGPTRRLLWTVILYFGATTLLVSMSRFRLPVVPLLLTGVAGLLTQPPKTMGARLRILPWLAALGFAWWLNAPTLADVWKLVLLTDPAS